MPLAEPPHTLAQSRFVGVVAGHWPVFAVLAAVLILTVVIGLLRRRTEPSTMRSAEVATAQIVGWVTVLVLPPLIYVAALAAGFSVQSPPNST